jgi:hypothetical protein
MQVDNSKLHQTLFVPQEDTHSTSLFPLHGYHQKLSITTSSWTLPAFATQVTSLPAELIDMIQAYCSNDDLLSLTSVDKTALATRFCNPRLQKLCFKTEKDIEQFLAYCQALQEKETEELVLEEGQKSRKRLKTALLFDPTTQFISFTREHLQTVNTLTLTLSAQFTAEQYDLLFTHLPGIQHLTIYSTQENQCALGRLFKAAQHLTLYYLAICHTNCPDDRKDFKSENNLLDELWQLTTLETLRINGLRIYSISEKISQLTALKSLKLEEIRSLKVLPASLGQLGKLEKLKLYILNIKRIPEEIGQLKALKSLKLIYLPKIKALPASIGQLNKLEALILEDLYYMSAFPEEMGRLRALKSLTLRDIHKLEALPTSIGQLDKLEMLTLEGLSSITALPEEMGQLKALKIVKLSNIAEFGVLPGKLAQIVGREA